MLFYDLSKPELRGWTRSLQSLDLCLERRYVLLLLLRDSSQGLELGEIGGGSQRINNRVYPAPSIKLGKKRVSRLCFVADIFLQAASHAVDALLHKGKARKFTWRVHVVEIPVDMQRSRTGIKHIYAVERSKTRLVPPFHLLWLFLPEPKCDTRGRGLPGCLYLGHVGKYCLRGADCSRFLQHADVSGFTACVLSENHRQLGIELNGLAFD